MFSLIRTLSLRQARRHPARLCLMVLSVSLGVAAWVTTQVLDQTLGQALQASSAPMAGAADFHVSHGEIGVSADLAAKLRAVAGVAGVRPLLVKRVLMTAPVKQAVVLIGVDIAAERAKAGEAGLTIEGASAADFARAMLTGATPVAIGEGLNKTLGAEAKSLEVLVSGSVKRLTKVGIINANGPAASLGGQVILTDLKITGQLVGESKLVTRIDVMLDAQADRNAVKRDLESVVGSLAEVLTPESQAARVQDALESLRIGFSLCGAGGLGIALLLTTGAFGVGVAERRTEVGLLRALGAERGQVATLFLMEAAILGLLGSLIGLPVGIVVARLSSGPMLRVLSDVFVPLDARPLDIDVWACLTAIAAGMITTVLASLIPTIKSAFREPLRSLRKGPVESGRRGAMVWVIASIFAFSIALLCHASSPRGSRFQVFSTLVGSLVGTVLAIPAVTSFAAALLRPLAERWLGPPGRLAADRLVRHPAGGGLAIASLAGGMALILQTGGVIHGNEEAVRGWVDTCIAGDLFVTSGGPLSASGKTLPMSEDIGTKLTAMQPGATAVPMSFRYLPWSYAGRESRIMLMAMDAHKYYEANQAKQPPLADLPKYRDLMMPGTALVSENFAALYDVSIGQMIELPTSSGTITLKVVGTVVDFSCNRGLVMVDRPSLAEKFGISGVDVFSVSVPNRADVSNLEESISQSEWAAEGAIVVVPHAALREHILGMVSRLYGVAYVQEVAAAVVAALGVATALLISVLQRRREIGLLRAIGATPAQAVTLILAEAGLMAIVGITFGLLIGSALEWYVLRVVLLVETGFLFPVRFPWSHALIVGSLALVGSFIAAFGPAVRAARLRIPEAIAYE